MIKTTNMNQKRQTNINMIIQFILAHQTKQNKTKNKEQTKQTMNNNKQ